MSSDTHPYLEAHAAKADALEAVRLALLTQLEKARELLAGTGSIERRALAGWVLDVEEAVQGESFTTTLADTLIQLRREADPAGGP